MREYKLDILDNMPSKNLHLGFVVDSGEVLTVVRERRSEYEALQQIARSLPGGEVSPSDYSPAAAVYRQILEQTGFHTLVGPEPLLSWKQRAGCTSEKIKYTLWPAHLVPHPQHEILDDNIVDCRWVALEGLQQQLRKPLRIDFLRQVLSNHDVVELSTTTAHTATRI